MAVQGLPPNAPIVKAEPGPNNDAVQNLANPLNSALSTLHSAFGGSASQPVLNSSAIGVQSKVSLPGGASVYVSNGRLIYKSSTGNAYRLDRQNAGLQSGDFGVLASSSVLTWSGSGGSGQAYTYAVPASYNSSTVHTVVVGKVACSLLSGTPGTSATFSVAINGNTYISARALPTSGGTTNVSIADFTLSWNPTPGQTIVTIPGGTFSGSSTWRVDIIGYYL